jgi:hypothetical protein
MDFRPPQTERDNPSSIDEEEGRDSQKAAKKFGTPDFPVFDEF